VTSAVVRRNLALVPAFTFTSEFFLIVPVLVTWYAHHGLGSSAVFVTQAVFGIAMFFLEVPSGFLADALGRRRTLLFGALFWPLSLCVYRAGDSLSSFIAAELLAAVAVSCQSGCLSALLFDSLKSLGREADYLRFEGRQSAIARWGCMVASVMGGLLARVGLAWPFNVNILTFFGLLPLAYVMVEPERDKPELRHAWREIWQVTGHCLRPGPLLPWVVGVGVVSCIGLVSLWASLIAYRVWGLSLAWQGVLFAGFQGAGILGGLWGPRLLAHLGAQRFLWVLCLQGPLLLLVGVAPEWLLVPVAPLLALSWNMALPFFYNGLNRRTDSRMRATVLSVSSLMARAFFIGVGPLFGVLTDQGSLPMAFFVLGGVALPAWLWLAWRLPPLEANSLGVVPT